MKIVLGFFFGWLCVAQAIGQNDSLLLKQAEKEIENGSATLSSVLTNPSYVSIHPLTPFREMLKRYCNSIIMIVKICADHINHKNLCSCSKNSLSTVFPIKQKRNYYYFFQFQSILVPVTYDIKASLQL